MLPSNLAAPLKCQQEPEHVQSSHVPTLTNPMFVSRAEQFGFFTTEDVRVHLDHRLPPNLCRSSSQVTYSLSSTGLEPGGTPLVKSMADQRLIPSRASNHVPSAIASYTPPCLPLVRRLVSISNGGYPVFEITLGYTIAFNP